MSKTETETIEYKKSLAELKEGLISIVAILNKHKHGELWFGIRNDGKAVGIDAKEKTLSKTFRNCLRLSAEVSDKVFKNVP